MTIQIVRIASRIRFRIRLQFIAVCDRHLRAAGDSNVLSLIDRCDYLYRRNIEMQFLRLHFFRSNLVTLRIIEDDIRIGIYAPLRIRNIDPGHCTSDIFHVGLGAGDNDLVLFCRCFIQNVSVLRFPQCLNFERKRFGLLRFHPQLDITDTARDALNTG